NNHGAGLVNGDEVGNDWYWWGCGNVVSGNPILGNNTWASIYVTYTTVITKVQIHSTRTSFQLWGSNQPNALSGVLIGTYPMTANKWNVVNIPSLPDPRGYVYYYVTYGPGITGSSAINEIEGYGY